MGFSGAEKLNLLLSLEEVSVWVHMRMSQATITGAANLYSCGRNLLQSTCQVMNFVSVVMEQMEMTCLAANKHQGVQRLF